MRRNGVCPIFLVAAGRVLLAAALLGGTQTPAAQAPAADAVVLRFVVYGDTRTHDDIHAAVVRAVVAAKPALLLQTGDLVAHGDNPTEWKKFDEIIAPIREGGIAYYPARGNHDVRSNGEYEKRVTQPFRPGGDKLNYAFDAGNLRFLAINTVTEDRKSAVDKKWVESELAQAEKDGKFVIPFFHIAIFSIGHHGSDPALQPVLHALFKKYHVRLVFQGHDHNYYHTTRDGITYVVTGGGGAPLYGDDHKEQGISGDVFLRQNNYCVCEVYANRIVVTAYASPDPRKEPFVKVDTFSVPLTP